MDNKIAAKLLQLNAEFYQTFAVQFSDTRQRLQPGVLRILDRISSEARILDLGCGNGELARTLLAQGGFRGQYLGLDFSRELLDVAREGLAEHPGFTFILGNLADKDWESQVASYKSPADSQSAEFGIVLSFAALHHLPGHKAHLQILRAVRGLLPPGGQFIHSNWQFLNSARLRQRVHPWPEIGLSEAEVDPGDYLLDWRRGGFGLRYVHHFSENELHTLADETGFRIIESFFSDGESGNLGLYQVWE